MNYRSRLDLRIARALVAVAAVAVPACSAHSPTASSGELRAGAEAGEGTLGPRTGNGSPSRTSPNEEFAGGHPDPPGSPALDEPGALASPGPVESFGTFTDFYPFVWGELPVAWAFASSFPVDGRDVARWGASQWAVAGSSFSFVEGRAEEGSWDPSVCGPEQIDSSVLHAGPLDGMDGLLAVTHTCVRNSTEEAVSFQLQIDSDENWHQRLDAPPADSYDLAAVLTHEFGHATMWEGHHDTDLRCNADQPLETMCPSLPPGRTDWRSLSEPEVVALRTTYPD